MYSKVILVGRLGADPEFKHASTGMPMATLRLAVDEKRKDGKHTHWFRIKCFGKLAETVSNYLRKGNKCFIEGKLLTSSYEKDGQKITSIDIIADRVPFIHDKNEDGVSGPSGAPVNTQTTCKEPPSFPSEDLPF